MIGRGRLRGGVIAELLKGRRFADEWMAADCSDIYARMLL
jgi:hypothetical protein